MLVDNFWKIIFIVLVGIGCWFWWKDAEAKKVHSRQIGALAELIDGSDAYGPRSDKEASERIFKAVAMLKTIADRQEDKFNVDSTLNEALEGSEMDDEVIDIIDSVIARNYEVAHELGLLEDEDAMFRMEEGAPPKIKKGTWEGQYAEVGYYIPPRIEDSVSSHLGNRLIMPEGIKGALSAGVFNRTIESTAKMFKRAKLIDLATSERILKEYSFRKSSSSLR